MMNACTHAETSSNILEEVLPRLDFALHIRIWLRRKIAEHLERRLILCKEVTDQRGGSPVSLP
jgi:hypothetical protein